MKRGRVRKRKGRKALLGVMQVAMAASLGIRRALGSDYRFAIVIWDANARSAYGTNARDLGQLAEVFAELGLRIATKRARGGDA